MREFLLISGSLRVGSSNTAALRAAQRLFPSGTTGVLYGGLADLPAFNPDLENEPPVPVRSLRSAIHDASGLLFCVPEYAGAMPGSVKNLLDWTIGDGAQGSIYNKPVGWINTSPRGAAGAHSELRTVLTYAHATIVDKACACVPLTSAALGEDGLVDDREAAERIRTVMQALVAAALGRPGHVSE